MVKSKVKIFLFPTFKGIEDTYFYFCNELKDKTLDIFKLDDLLTSLNNNFSITEINICGKLYTLSDFYFESLYNILKYYSKRILITTDLLRFNKPLVNNPDIINVYYNFNRTLIDEQKIFENIKSISNQKIVNVKSLDVNVTTKSKEIINKLNGLGIKSFEIIPYHQYIFSKFPFKDYSLYENTIQTFNQYKSYMKFSFQNDLQATGIYKQDNYNTTNVFLLPDNTYNLITFDQTNKWKFEKFSNIKDLREKIQEIETLKGQVCKNCTVKHKCMSNYFFNPFYKNISCSGAKNVLIKH